MRAKFRASLLAFILLSFAYAWIELPADPRQKRFALAPPIETGPSVPIYETRFASHEVTPSVHCATLVECNDRTLRAFWYGGTREGATDVAIYGSVFDLSTGHWSTEQSLITPKSTEGAVHRYVRKLGNPVVVRDREGRLWLFYVSVSVGGWSGSAINATLSEDEGRTWCPPKRLMTSPFLNLSTLVKGVPLHLEDGTIALPVYHEFIGLFGELLWLDRSGDVIGKSRLSRGAYSLQPVIVPRSPTEALALMRYAGSAPARILAVQTADSGHHWSQPKKLDLPNPNAAVACARLEDGSLLLVFNDSETGRDDLSLAWSKDEGQTWRIVHLFDEAPNREEGNRHEFSYPFLIRASDGDFHLLYTWYRTHIKHVRFNRAWLEQKLR
jgi:predicted neuraminidase